MVHIGYTAPRSVKLPRQRPTAHFALSVIALCLCFSKISFSLYPFPFSHSSRSLAVLPPLIKISFGAGVAGVYYLRTWHHPASAQREQPFRRRYIIRRSYIHALECCYNRNSGDFSYREYFTNYWLHFCGLWQSKCFTVLSLSSVYE